MLKNRWYKHFLFRLLLFVVVAAIATQFFFGQGVQGQSHRAAFVTEFNKMSVAFQGGDFDMLKEKVKQRQDVLASIAYQINLAKYYENKEPVINQKSDELYAQAIEASKALPDTGIQVFALAQRGYYHYKARRISQAMPDMVEVVFLLERHPSLRPPFEQEIYKQVGFFLGTIGDFEKANTFLHRSLVLTDSTKIRERAALLDNIGLYALQSKDTVSAFRYFEQAQLLAKQSRDKVRLAKIWGNLALIAWDKGERKQALGYLKEDIALSNIEGDSLNTLYATNILGKYLLEEGAVAEAKAYLERIRPFAEKQASLIVHRNTMHQLLLKLAIAEGDEAAEFRQRRLLFNMQDSLNLFDGENVTKQTRWQADREIIAEQLAQSTHEYVEEKKKSRFLTGLATCIVLLLVSFYLVTYVRNQKEKKMFQQQIKQMEQIPDVTSVTDVNRVEHEEMDRLHQLLASRLITEENWRKFKRTFVGIYPDFYQELTLGFPELSESNLRIAVLQKLDLSNDEISDLLGVTQGAIKKSKQRLRKKMGEEQYALFRDLIHRPLS